MPALHPFLVDQRPFLPRASSSSSVSVSSVASSASSGSAITSKSTSGVQRIYPNTTTSSTSFSISGYTRPCTSRRTSSPSPSASSSTSSSILKPIAGVDRECLLWMRGAEEWDHTFGSCERIGGLSEEERSMRREMELRSVENQTAATQAGSIKEEKRRRRLGRIFWSYTPYII